MKSYLRKLLLLYLCLNNGYSTPQAAAPQFTSFWKVASPQPSTNSEPAESHREFRESAASPLTPDDRVNLATYPLFEWPLEYQLNEGVLITNYVDLDGTPGIRDYQGGTHSYDGHNGTDISVRGFRSMDRGAPVLAAADGVVTFVEYSQFDRHTEWLNGVTANSVTLRHANSSYSRYLHFRKDSVTVAVGETVRAGQVVGLVGSSGRSTAPHLHFEPGEFINNIWNKRDPWNGSNQPLPGLWKAQEPYVGFAPLRINDMSVFTQAAAGGDITRVSDSALKEQPTQPAILGADEPFVAVWLDYQGQKGDTYTVEVDRPNGTVYATRTSSLTAKGRGRVYWYWTFRGNVSAADYGTWTARILINGNVAKQVSFDVGSASVYAPRFSPLSGKSFRINGTGQQDRLTVSPLGGPVTYSLVNAPSSVTLTGDTVTIGATSTQPYRSAYFQVNATDSGGRQDVMWYHLVDPSKPFFPGQARATFETPTNGATVAGNVPLQGWSALLGSDTAFASTRVDLLVDDRLAGQLLAGGTRQDVKQTLASQNITAPGNLGFSGTWDSRSVADGAHTLTIRAGDVVAGRLEVVSESTISVITNKNLTSSSSSAFNVPDRGGSSSRTLGNPGSTTVGFARIQPATNNTTPAGLAIFGFRQNNVLVTEASVPASQLRQSGRIYAQVGGSANTGLAIANPNNQPAMVSFYFTDSNGANFGQGATTIPANGQIAAFLDQSPFSGGSSVNGTFTFSSSSPISVIALRGLTNERSEFLITTLPVIDLSPGTGDNVIFPHFANGGGWTTSVILVNPTDNTLSGTVQFFSQGSSTASGQPVMVTVDDQTRSSFSYTVSARSSRPIQTTGLAGTTQVGWVKVVPATNNTAPAGLLIFSFKKDGTTVSETGVPALRLGTAFRLYAEGSGNFIAGEMGSLQTGVAIANPSAVAANVNFEITALSGAALGPAGSVVVPGQGQVAMFLNQIQGLSSLPFPFQAIVRISTSSPSGVSVIGLRGRYNERADFLITTTPPVNEGSTASTSEIVFPHFAEAGGYTTQFILFSSTPGQSSSGVFRFFSQSGQPLNLILR